MKLWRQFKQCKAEYGLSGKCLLLIVLVLVGFIFFALGSGDLSSPDEPRYALVAKEMMDQGHWLLPYRNDRPYPDKPPLFFWSVAASSYMLGGEVTSWSARLPSALAAVGVLILLAWWARGSEEEDRVLMWLAPLLLISSVRFFFQARMAQIDMLLCLFTTGAFYLGFQALTGKNYRPFLLGLCMGLGCLAKGPVAYLLPLGVFVVFSFLRGRTTWRRFPWVGFIWGILPPLLWIGALLVEVAYQDQWAYLSNLLYDQTVVRFFNSWTHIKPFYYFLVTILHDFFPWVFFLIAAIPFTARARAALSERQLFAWVVVTFVIVFFSLSKGKRNLYLLPLFPFAAYLAADYLRQVWSAGNPHWPYRVLWVVPALVLVAAGLDLAALGLGFYDPTVIDQVEAPFPAFAASFSGLLLVVVNIYGLIHLRKPVPVRFPIVLTGSMLCLCLFFYGFGLPWISERRSARAFSEIAAEVIRARTRGEVVLGMVDFRAAYRFYGSYPVRELAPLEMDRASPKLIGLPDLPTFFKEQPYGWVIIRKEHLDAYWVQYPELKTQTYLSREVGRGYTLLLIRLRLPAIEPLD